MLKRLKDLFPIFLVYPLIIHRLIARVLELQGRDLPSLLELTQLSVTQFMQQDTLLTSQQQVQILDNALRLSDNDAFGLQLA